MKMVHNVYLMLFVVRNLHRLLTQLIF